MNITKINISKIIKDFGQQARIFQKEAQFQFELAWELQKQIGKDGKVILECNSCVRKANDTDNQKKKRFYSDIIIKNNNNDYIVIELKYKTKNDNLYGVELTEQGAPNEGRYDYLWDIRRIELLKNHDRVNYDYNSDFKNFLGGYAILLTNENQYWERTKSKAMTDGKETVDIQFSIGQGDNVSGTVDWQTDGRKSWMTSRPTITFDHSYTFDWESYYNTGQKTKRGRTLEFKYLVTKINA